MKTLPISQNFFYTITILYNFPLKFILLFYKNHRQLIAHKIKEISKSSDYKHNNKKKTTQLLLCLLTCHCPEEKGERSRWWYIQQWRHMNSCHMYVSGRKRNSNMFGSDTVRICCVSSGRMKEGLASAWPFIQVSVGGRIRGEPGAARAFCGIDYSLLSRCTSRVKSAPLSTAVTPSSTPSTAISSSLFPVSLSPLPLMSDSHSLPLPPSLSLTLPFLSSDLSFTTNRYLISTPSLSLSTLFLRLNLLRFRSPCSETLPHLRGYRVQRERKKYVCTLTRCSTVLLAPPGFRRVRSYVIADRS